MPSVLSYRDLCYIPEGAIYIGRRNSYYGLSQSIWANPFKVGQNYQGRILTHEDCIEAHRDWFLYSDEGINLQGFLQQILGLDLICWCHDWDLRDMPPTWGCHGDLLLIMSNRRYERQHTPDGIVYKGLEDIDVL